MIAFDLWIESLIFAAVYAVCILVPCAFVAILGRRTIEELGRWPTQTAAIQMKVCLKLIFLEIGTFLCLIGFYHVFAD